MVSPLVDRASFHAEKQYIQYFSGDVCTLDIDAYIRAYRDLDSETTGQGGRGNARQFTGVLTATGDAGSNHTMNSSTTRTGALAELRQRLQRIEARISLSPPLPQEEKGQRSQDGVSESSLDATAASRRESRGGHSNTLGSSEEDTNRAAMQRSPVVRAPMMWLPPRRKAPPDLNPDQGAVHVSPPASNSSSTSAASSLSPSSPHYPSVTQSRGSSRLEAPSPASRVSCALSGRHAAYQPTSNSSRGCIGSAQGKDTSKGNQVPASYQAGPKTLGVLRHFSAFSSLADTPERGSDLAEGKQTNKGQCDPVAAPVAAVGTKASLTRSPPAASAATPSGTGQPTHVLASAEVKTSPVNDFAAAAVETQEATRPQVDAVRGAGRSLGLSGKGKGPSDALQDENLMLLDLLLPAGAGARNDGGARPASARAGVFAAKARSGGLVGRDSEGEAREALEPSDEEGEKNGLSTSAAGGVPAHMAAGTAAALAMLSPQLSMSPHFHQSVFGGKGGGFLSGGLALFATAQAGPQSQEAEEEERARVREEALREREWQLERQRWKRGGREGDDSMHFERDWETDKIGRESWRKTPRRSLNQSVGEVEVSTSCTAIGREASDPLSLSLGKVRDLASGGRRGQHNGIGDRQQEHTEQVLVSSAQGDQHACVLLGRPCTSLSMACMKSCF